MPQSDMVNASAIRDRFRHFLGTERYERFVRVVNEFSIADGRLRYWQQQLWKQFADAESLPAEDHLAISVFSVCCVHGNDLQSVSLEPRRPRDPHIHIDPAPPDPGELRAEAELFPMAFVRIQPQENDSGYEVGWYCQLCKDVERKWRTKAFTKDISRPDCPIVSLYIDNSAAKYPGDTPQARIVRYYRGWRIPDTPSDPELLRIHTAICSARASVLGSEPASYTMLATLSGMFTFQMSTVADRSIHDHCKMHYIAINKIATASTDRVA